MAENNPPSEQPITNPPPQLPKPQPQMNQPPFKRVVTKPKKGDLVGFRYTFWKHDPHPLVLVTALYSDGRIAGINLHNLTIWDMKNIVSRYCNKSVISYQIAVKGKKEIEKGFRTYKWEGIRDLMIVNCDNFLSRLGVVREKKLLSPNEVEKLRIQVQQQLRRQINPRAADLTKYSVEIPTGTVPGKPASIPGISVGEGNSGE